MLKTEEFFVNMGPQHPSTHGVLRLILQLDGEMILNATPVIGYLHRGLEKIAENRTYHQYIPYTDRLDYVTSMTSNLVYVLAVERLAEIECPRRAQFIRVIMAELNRIASHLLWWGCLGLELGATTPFLYAFRDREKVLDLFEMVCGARLTYNYMRIGGVAYDVQPEFVQKCKEFMEYFRPCLKEYDELLTGNVIFENRVRNIGILPLDTAIKYGVSGPNLRASGLKWDLRKDEPYLVYPQIDFDIPTGSTGDIWDRYAVRLEEIRQSLRIIEQCLKMLPGGEYKKRLSLRITPPEGEVYVRTESPRGDIGAFIVSDGTEKPYRLKFRTPSFSHVQVLPEMLRGVLVADAVVIAGSLDIILPETDR